MLKSPYPWFGGKSRIAPEVWRRFGDTPNYVEPFFGSGAVLLARPDFDGYRTETVNDLDGHVSNFWRAVQADPAEVARHAAMIVSELDLHARGTWLFYRPSAREWVEQLRGDPEYYDAKSAGWWVWFVSSWTGGLPAVPEDGKYGRGVNRRLPHLGDAGRGVNRLLTYAPRKAELLTEYFEQLAARLERVRVCCGDWRRALTPALTVRHGLTAVFLDPPYSKEAGRTAQIYSVESDSVAHAVREWAIANGDNPLLRIALCGYDSEHDGKMPDGWHRHAWKTAGGYGSRGNGNGRANAHREVVWFSPHCLRPVTAEEQPTLFSVSSNGKH